MITTEEAQKIISSQIRGYGTEMVSLENGINRVLREDLKADRDFPPYNRVSMDGIAIQHAVFANGQKVFPVVGIAAAGSSQLNLDQSAACVEVMTGAILPANTDTVIRYEDVEITDGKATVVVNEIREGQNVHNQGLDRKAGEIVVKLGSLLSAPEIGIGATVGTANIQVSKVPRTLIVSSGDELVEIDEKPAPHQIRKSNTYLLKASLKQYGIRADQVHLVDDLEKIKIQLTDFFSNYDVIILSGGVSKGKFDFIPQALETLGVNKFFHKVKQRPGKPFWFGKHPQGTLVFALPGNPVSSFMCLQCYVLPWLTASLGLTSSFTMKGRLAKDVVFKPDLAYFMQVKVEINEEGYFLAIPVEGHGSGDLANLVDADGFLQLPIGKEHFKSGEVYPLHLYRNQFF
ncbi:MAG: molybdopterin molybdotransferase MoeA [Bacteroidota bacterium]